VPVRAVQGGAEEVVVDFLAEVSEAEAEALSEHENRAMLS